MLWILTFCLAPVPLAIYDVYTTWKRQRIEARYREAAKLN